MRGRRQRLRPQQMSTGHTSATHTTASHVERDVLTTMLPDDAEVTGENHPWEWLASLIRNHGMAELPRRGHAQPIERQGQ